MQQKRLMLQYSISKKICNRSRNTYCNRSFKFPSSSISSEKADQQISIHNVKIVTCFFIMRNCFHSLMHFYLQYVLLKYYDNNNHFTKRKKEQKGNLLEKFNPFIGYSHMETIIKPYTTFLGWYAESGHSTNLKHKNNFKFKKKKVF